MAKRNQRVQLLKLSEDERANYMRIALALQSVPCDPLMAKRLILTYERIGKLGGDFSVEDAVDIDMKIKEEYERTEKGDES